MTGGRATPLDRKVDIFVAGFQKCGTSALCDLLDRHPQIGLSRPKEPAWFSGGRLARSEEEYLGFFPAKKTLWVDGSTAYSFPENAASVAAGIHKHNPEAKFIFVVRNPVNRVRSVLNHAMFENEKKLTPDQIVQRATRRSAYYAPISCFSSYFEKEAIFVLSMDELLLTQGKTVIDFLGLERLEEPLRPVNYTATRRKENFLTGFTVAIGESSIDFLCKKKCDARFPICFVHS